MNQTLALKVLSAIMDWDDDRAREEFAWLRLMSHYKYDSYQDFVAGARFIESLADWLQQFEPGERETAYSFLKSSLIYVGPGEMNHLVELAYPETIQRRLLQAVALRLGVPFHAVWSNSAAAELFASIRRRALFLALSDGARIDTFRRANTGLISNEQVFPAVQVGADKWSDLLDTLRREARDDSARFEYVFLLDDFTASGETLIRKDGSEWKGKLPKFWGDIREKVGSHFSQDLIVVVHHYIGTEKARRTVTERNLQITEDPGANGWFPYLELTFGCLLPEEVMVSAERNPEFVALARKYYNPAIQTRHTEVGGTSIELGFGQCALPVVLEHNTPNNSVALLWAETEASNAHPAMRPLFRRRQRHS
jgi:hypothetical protein